MLLFINHVHLVVLTFDLKRDLKRDFPDLYLQKYKSSSNTNTETLQTVAAKTLILVCRLGLHETALLQQIQKLHKFISNCNFSL